MKSKIKNNNLNSEIEDWDKIVISKKGKKENENYICYNSIINIAFPVKPSFSCLEKTYEDELVYKYKSSFKKMDFNLTFQKNSFLDGYDGIYNIIEKKSDEYEESIERIKENPFNFLESNLEYSINKDIGGIEITKMDYVIKRRFSRGNLCLVEYFINNIELDSKHTFVKGQLVLFLNDNLLSHLYVTSRSKVIFNENYYYSFVTSFNCHLNIKDYVLNKSLQLKRKTKKVKKKIKNKINNI